MSRSLGIIVGLVLAGPAVAEPPAEIADLVKQLGDTKFTRREAAQNELLKRGEGIVPELDRLAKTADAETAERIRKIRYTLVGYKDDIRRLLAGVHEGKDSGAVPISAELRGLIAGHQPGSGDLLVSILARPDHPLYRRALRTFVAAWDVATPDQIDRYVQQVVTLKINHHRPKFPAKVGAMISVNVQLRDGWTGWPQPDPKGFTFQTRTIPYVDGQPHGKPFDYRYPFGTLGWYRVGELAEGKHTIHTVMEYEFTHRGQKRRGEIRSKESTFEVVSADTPDDLVARPSKAIAKSVRNALSFLNYEGEDIKPDPLKPGTLSPREDIAWQPQVSWYTDNKESRAGVHCPVWQLKHELDVDLCFDVSIREVKTGTVHASDPIVIPKATKSGGWGYVVPRDPRAFAKGRDGFVAVQILLKPSRAQALTDPRVTSYFPDEIESGELKMKVIPKIEPVKGR